MSTATFISVLDTWAPNTLHYECSDGKHLAVEVMPIPDEAQQVIETGQAPMVDDLLVKMGVGRASLRMVIRPTLVFLCDENGQPIDADENDYDPLTPLHTFPAGTPHQEALQAIGYTLDSRSAVLTMLRTS